jgi:hypothetical protein
MSTAHATENLTYHVFVNEWPQQTNGFLPNGEPKQFSRQASTLICGSENAVLTDPGMTADQAGAVGDWIAEKGTKRDRHLRHLRSRRSLVRRWTVGRAVCGSDLLAVAITFSRTPRPATTSETRSVG